MSYTLDSAEVLHSETPDTFQIPPLSVRRNLKLGMLVKLIFKHGEAGRIDGERMWVEIVEILKDQKYTGILRNNPAFVNLKYGAQVTFGAEHVASIESPED